MPRCARPIPSVSGMAYSSCGARKAGNREPTFRISHGSGTWLNYIGILQWPPSNEMFTSSTPPANNTNNTFSYYFLVLFPLSSTAIDLIFLFPICQSANNNSNFSYSPFQPIFLPSSKQASTSLQPIYPANFLSNSSNHCPSNPHHSFPRNPPLHPHPHTYNGTWRIQWPSNHQLRPWRVQRSH
jgi:hypothetical protein